MSAPRSVEAPLVEAAAIEDDRTDPWREALCRDQTGYSTMLFFSDDLSDIAVAKAICSQCPLSAPCLEGAAERREPCGVWGGELFADGVILAYKRKRGRPPKVRESEVALIA